MGSREILTKERALNSKTALPLNSFVSGALSQIQVPIWSLLPISFGNRFIPLLGLFLTSLGLRFVPGQVVHVVHLAGCGGSELAWIPGH